MALHGCFTRWMGLTESCCKIVSDLALSLCNCIFLFGHLHFPITVSPMHRHLRKIDWLMAHAASLVFLICTVSGCCQNALGRGSACNRYKSKLEQSRFSLDIYGPIQYGHIPLTLEEVVHAGCEVLMKVGITFADCWWSTRDFTPAALASPQSTY